MKVSPIPTLLTVWLFIVKVLWQLSRRNDIWLNRDYNSLIITRVRKRDVLNDLVVEILLAKYQGKQITVMICFWES